MADLIDKQAAIDEIDEWIKAFRENGHKESAADAHLIQNGIIQLPSAQPEIIRCKDCKYYTRAWLKKDGTENRRYKNSVCLRGKYAVSHNPDWYCGDAERRDHG